MLTVAGTSFRLALTGWGGIGLYLLARALTGGGPILINYAVMVFVLGAVAFPTRADAGDP